MGSTMSHMSPSTLTGVSLVGIAALLYTTKGTVKRAILKRLLDNMSTQPSKSTGALIALLSKGEEELHYFDDLLPDLPVPEVKETVDAFLRSVRPLLSSEEFSKTEALAADFLSSEAPDAQKWLQKRAATHRNWLSELWLDFAYLYGRDSLMINVSFYSTEQLRQPVKTTDPCARAAGVTVSMLDFYSRVASQRLRPTKAGGVIPADMSGYDMLMGTSRVPAKPKDKLRTHFVDVARAGEQGGRRAGWHKDGHIIVTIGNLMFKIQVQVDGKRVSQRALEASIRQAFQVATSEEAGGIWRGQNLAVLTTDNRDHWADMYQRLSELGAQNVASLNDLETALIHVSIAPDLTPEADVNVLNRLAWHGDTRRVWYDKCITALIFGNGRAGLVVEHTWADAPVASHLWECALVEEVYDAEGKAPSPEPEAQYAPSVAGPEMLEWVGLDDPAVVAGVAGAEERAKALVESVHLRTIVHEDFGKDMIKRFGISPDAVCQAVLQIAARQYFGRPVLTYESASLRQYYRGRTETIRSATSEMCAFTAAFIDPEVSEEEKVNLLRVAGKQHVATARKAMTMKGVDRHMMGLKLAAVLSGKTPHPFFASPGCSLTWQLSTSQTPLVQEHTSLPPHLLSYGGGFGPVAADGIGCAYFVLPEYLYFTVSGNGLSGKHDPKSGVEEFERLIRKALKDMQTLMKSAIAAKENEGSKL